MFAEKGIGKFLIYLNAFHLLFSLPRLDSRSLQSFNIDSRADVYSGSTADGETSSKKLIHYAVLSLKFSI